MFPTHPQTIIRSAVCCSLASRRNRARLPLTDFPFDLPDLLADLRCRCADGPGCPCVCIGPLAFRCVSVDSRLNKGPGHPPSKVMLPLTWISRPWVPSLGVIKFPLITVALPNPDSIGQRSAPKVGGVGKHIRYIILMFSPRVSNCIVQYNTIQYLLRWNLLTRPLTVVRFPGNAASHGGLDGRSVKWPRSGWLGRLRNFPLSASDGARGREEGEEGEEEDMEGYSGLRRSDKMRCQGASNTPPNARRQSTASSSIISIFPSWLQSEQPASRNSIKAPTGSTSQ